MKKLFLTVCIFLGLNACSDDVNPNTPESVLAPMKTFKSYIQTFVNCKKKMAVSVVVGVEIDETKKIFGLSGPSYDRLLAGETNPDVFSVSDGMMLEILGHWQDSVFNDTCIIFDADTSSALDGEGRTYYIETKTKYDYYTALIGDTSYNAQLRGDEGPNARAIITPLNSITIVADRNFSSDYPAGSDLSPLFTVYFDDLYSTVKNGYKPVEGTYRFYENLPYPQSIVKVKLSEANFAGRPFIGVEWYCLLDVAPEKTDTYTFRVKSTFIDGTVLEATAPPINIKGVNG
ncbi:MAG: hypothetical protein LBQ22_07670 [Bacteroidales bacterium]|nr:hypothetical protein [Bacteroidales bacterium]